MTEQAPETVEPPPLTADELFVIRDALAHRLADIGEVATRFIPSPRDSAEAARKWQNMLDYKATVYGLLAKLPQVEPPEGEPATFA